MTDPDGGILEQLEALRGVIIRSLAAVVITIVPGFFVAPYLLSGMIKYSCPENMRLNYFTPLEPFFVQMNVGLIIAVAVSSVWIFWQIGSFVSPGLYKNEKRKLLQLSFVSAFLFITGGCFGFFGVLPMVMKFSYSFATPEIQPVIGIGNFLKMVTMLMLGFAASFQFPVVLVLLAELGIINPGTLRRKRPLVITVIFIVAAFLTPPDIVSQLAMALPAWLLFELTLLWIERMPEKKCAASEPEAAVPEVPSAEREKKVRRRKIRPL